MTPSIIDQHGRSILDIRQLDWLLVFEMIDIGILGEHLKLIEDEIERISKDALVERESKLIELRARHLDREEYEAESQWTYQEYWSKVDFELPRMFRGPVLIMLYGVYESAFRSLANELDMNLERKPDNLGFLERFCTRFKKLTCIDTPNDWGHMQILEDLRTAIAHCNGRISLIGKDRAKRIKQYKNIGVTIDRHGLIIQAELLTRFYSAVKDTLDYFTSSQELEKILIEYSKRKKGTGS